MKKMSLATEADVVYMIYPEEVARKKLVGLERSFL